MRNQKNFTTGVLSGICGVLLLFMLTGTTTRETTSVTSMYEFYDLKTTKGVVFNKVTGEIKYEEIREEPLNEYMQIEVANWNGRSMSSRYFD